MRSLALTPLLLLAACAAPEQGAAGCHTETVATLPLSPGTRHVVVPGKLKQSDARYILDTGAERSSVVPDAVQQFGLAHTRSGQARTLGVGGIVTSRTVFANIELGGFETRREVPVVGTPVRVPEGTPLAGIIGADLLSNYDLEISFPERRVRLWRVRDCTGDYTGWAGRHWSVPLRRTTAGRLMLSVTLDGQQLTAMLDTGSNATMLGSDGARRLGLSEASMAADPSGFSRGVDANLLQSRLHRFNTLTIGPETLSGPRLAVSEAHLSQEDLLLGTDWLQSRRAWISWATRQILVQRGEDIRGP